MYLYDFELKQCEKFWKFFFNFSMFFFSKIYEILDRFFCIFPSPDPFPAMLSRASTLRGRGFMPSSSTGPRFGNSSFRHTPTFWRRCVAPLSWFVLDLVCCELQNRPPVSTDARLAFSNNAFRLQLSQVVSNMCSSSTAWNRATARPIGRPTETMYPRGFYYTPRLLCGYSHPGWFAWSWNLRYAPSEQNWNLTFCVNRICFVCTL